MLDYDHRTSLGEFESQFYGDAKSQYKDLLFLMPMGLMINLKVDVMQTFAQVKNQLWKQAESLPGYDTLHVPTRYAFNCYNSRLEKEEIFDENIRLYEFKIFRSIILVVEKIGDRDEKLLNMRIGSIICLPIFRGKIDPTPSYYNEHARPWDATGYAGIRSYPFWNTWGDLELSERTTDLHRWQQFEFRVRGDGRPYRIQLWFKSRWGDPQQEGTKFWAAHLQTRGGPYWERIKIPFNRFYPVKHEQIAGILHKPATMRLYSIGFFTDQQTPGDFSLEIDSIRALNTFVDEDGLYGPESIWKWAGNQSVTQNQEILGKYRKSRVYSKHDHILLD